MTPNISPPKLAEWLLSKLMKNDLLEEVLGDLEEKFFVECESRTLFKAKLNYWYQVFNYMRPFALKNSIFKNSNHTAMFRYNIKIAWRTMLNQKVYSFIKIGGFAIGIMAFILIGIFVNEEMSYDKHYKNKDRLYRLLNVYSDPADFGRGTAFPAQIAAAIRDNFPEVESVGRLIPYNSWWDAGDNQFRPQGHEQNTYEEGFAYADPELLGILEIPLIYGDKKDALSKPNSLVISKKKADKYFPGINPVGKTVFLNEDEAEPFLIGGVMDDFPKSSHLQFDFFITLTGKEFWPGEQTNWCCWNYNPYLLVRPGTDPRELEEKLAFIKDNYILKFEEETGDTDIENTRKYFSFELQPVSEIHLYTADLHENVVRGDIKVVWMFVSIAIFILLLACINFINLSTAKSANRAKEVGLKKVMGSHRQQLVRQFLTESMLYSAISVGIGILLAWWLLPFFSQLADRSLTFPWEEVWFLPMCLVFIIFTGTVAGTYPSFYLSAFKPINVLKGTLSRGAKSSKLRSAMVVFQFTTSIVLIIGALLVHQQMSFILNKKVGFGKDQVVMLQGANTLNEKYDAFKHELLKIPGVESAARSAYLPVSGTKRDQNGFWLTGRDKIDISVPAQRWEVDIDFINTMDIKIVEGRGLTDIASDSSAIVINQTMAKKLNLENPIGAKISNWRSWNVVGVVEDFHFESLKHEIGALAMCRANWGSIVSIKTNTKDMSGLLAEMNDLWDQFMPQQPIRYDFLDESFENMYADVERNGNVFTAFAVLAIIVACLGLFGLSAFLVEQRSKEISIRKVLGAPVLVIMKLLTLNFFKLILLSMVIGFPIAWYLMTEWLGDFEYRIEIGWGVFVLSGMITAVIAFLTVSKESIKAALVNPAEGLRNE